MGSLSQEASSSRASSARAGPEVSRRASLLDGPLFAADRFNGSVPEADPDAPLAIGPNVRAANARATPALLRNGPTPAYLDLVRDALRRDPEATQPELEDQARQIEARDPERGEEFRRAVGVLEGDLSLAPFVGRVRPVSLGSSGESVAGGDAFLGSVAPNRRNLLDSDRNSGEGGTLTHGETQVALAGPALRLAPVAFRFLRGLIVGKAADEALKQHSEEDRPGKSNTFEALPEASGPSGPPPFEPDDPDPDDGRREGREAAPQDPPKVPGFKLEDRGTHIEIFPDDSEEFAKLFIVESRGNSKTQQLNSRIVRLIERVARRIGLEIELFGGATTEDGIKVEEKHLGKRDEKGRLEKTGSVRLDIMIRILGREEFLHGNTVDTRADGRTPSTRETKAGRRVLEHRANKLRDLLFMVPKLRAGEDLNEPALERFFEFLLRHYARDPEAPAPKDGPLIDEPNIFNPDNFVP